MTEMTISRNSRSGKPSELGSISNNKYFSGGRSSEAWLDPVLSADGLEVANVYFEPGCRSYWHYHENGQLLRVMAGTGWICDKGGDPQKIHVGDVIWCPKGTIHWHGADAESYMVHQTATYGKVEWYEEVTDQEYARTRRSTKL